ncbi:hypothetical protein VNI00_010890 [Paramarasmius palmivorus]|uniref:Uncharacterized protein n=1 Tax=Paramarasmius palmivorus TaxID=297713 RepID=A0AAW0CIB4_9AGAR
MASHHHCHCAQHEIESQLRSAFDPSRIAEVLSRSHDCCEREHQEHLTRIASLNTQLESLQVRYEAAQATITNHNRVEHSLLEANRRIAELTAQCDGLEANLEASREKNIILEAKVNKSETLFAGTVRDMRMWKEKYEETEGDLAIANQKVKAARKKTKKLCSMLKCDDDIPDISVVKEAEGDRQQGPSHG